MSQLLRITMGLAGQVWGGPALASWRAPDGGGTAAAGLGAAPMCPFIDSAGSGGKPRGTLASETNGVRLHWHSAAAAAPFQLAAAHSSIGALWRAVGNFVLLPFSSKPLGAGKIWPLCARAFLAAGGIPFRRLAQTAPRPAATATLTSPCTRRVICYCFVSGVFFLSPNVAP